MRFENQPFGRLPEIIFDKAFTTHPVQASDDRQPGGSRRPRRSPTCASSTTPTTCRTTRRSCSSAISRRSRRRRWSSSTSAACRAGKPVPRDIPKEPAHKAEQTFTVTRDLAAAGRGRVVPHHVRRASGRVPAAHPRRRFCRTATARASTARSSTRSRWRSPRSARPSSSSIPNLFYAVAIVQPGNKPEVVQRELQAQLDRVKTEGVTAAELNRAKRQFARDYILGRDTVQQKALHLAHAVVIHNDIKTADGEFDLFQNVTRGRRPARRADVLHAGVAHAADDPAEGRRAERRAAAGFEVPRDGGRR